MGSSLNSHWGMKVQTAGRWKVEGERRVLAILLIRIEKDAGGGVEIELVALL